MKPRNQPNPRLQHRRRQHQHLTTTSNKSGNTYRGNRKGSSRRGNKSGTRGLEQKDFKGETPELNAVLRLITEIMDQGFTFERFQDVLKNHVLKNFHKLADH